MKNHKSSADFNTDVKRYYKRRIIDNIYSYIPIHILGSKTMTPVTVNSLLVEDCTECVLFLH